QEKYADATLEVTSQVFTPLGIQISISPGIQKFLPSPYTYSITLGPREVTNLSFRFSVSAHERLGVNTGEIRFTNSTTGEVYKVVPVTIYVLPMARGMFDVSVVAPDQIKPGSSTTAQVILTNKGAMDSDVVVSMWLVSPTGENIFIEEKTTKVPAGDSRTMDFAVTIPENALEGNYTLLAIAEYPINGEILTVRGRTAIRVGEPGQRISILGLSPWMFGLLIAALVASGISGYFGYKYYKKRLLAKKRFLGTI
ncbi:MAG: NEW3 domain-containing protein, partial [Candidatus Hadarchaeales archaeon]